MEAEPEQNPHATTAAAQNSVIPLGWKPTAAEPVPVVRCVQIKKDGERCKKWSIRGYIKCRRHSGPGAMMKDGNVMKYAESVIEAARLRLIDNADMAVDVLEDLMKPGSGEQIRLKASTEILDRAGIRGGFEVSVEQELTISAADEVAKRLAKLASGAEAVNTMREKARAAQVAADESATDIVDAELVEDDPEQDTLF